MEKTNNIEEKFIHLVYFWLKHPENTNDRKAFEQAMQKFLNTTKFAHNKHFGKPAATKRPVVDDSYTYCLKVTFKDIDEHNNYQIEPAHKLFIEEAKPLWERVLIYDSEM
ncbi:Dabb family protein [Lutibacter sp. HS1-25]|uniref:Dabb family protein n=1 Tax=Lutibacter sp. HS1-25 TaxID=2485000 RepID=UPI0010128512|nr:Dabb family protein [Lutibacter sp. HS1-25]RXP61889.1 Dabb family protein [Lutibacter sp. HS1-25]